ncbi:hypothetical protein GW17_00051434 [Ensete ventricosum]|nr:hypothetical protein GW17_00051434 [Ensete ventricosum]
MGSRTSTISQKNSTVICLHEVVHRVELRSVFRALSQKFKILAIPDVLAHGKSYEHGFTKKRDGYKLCAKSRVESIHGLIVRAQFHKKCDDHKLCMELRTELSFDRFFMYHFGNSKYWPFPTY